MLHNNNAAIQASKKSSTVIIPFYVPSAMTMFTSFVPELVGNRERTGEKGYFRRRTVQKGILAYG